MKFVENLLIIFACYISIVYGVTSDADLADIWSKISADQCVEPSDTVTYALVDPTNCANLNPKCDFDATPKQFCSLPRTQADAASPVYACNNWYTSCNPLLTTTPAGATTVATTAAVTTVASADATTTVGAATTAGVSTANSATTATTNAGSTAVPTTNAATTPVSGATTVSAVSPTSGVTDPPPQMSDSAKKWVGSGDSTAVNSKFPVPQKATKDYIDSQQCCAMAKAGDCDNNKFYMRIICASTCGSTGTDIYSAGGAAAVVKAECK